MKLKNKKTGEIGNLELYKHDKRVCVWIDDVTEPDYIYDSLAELCEEWEDYEESKKYYYISDFGAIQRGDVGESDIDEMTRKDFGNHFETKEETEKAVEKLKAWKRLRDKGFRFYGWNRRYCDEINFQLDVTEDLSKDLDLLFGGEE